MLHKHSLAATVLSCSLLLPSYTTKSTVEERHEIIYKTSENNAARDMRRIKRHNKINIRRVPYSTASEIPPAPSEYCEGNYEDFKEREKSIDEMLEQFSNSPQQVLYILSDNDREKIRLLWTDLVDVYHALEQNCGMLEKQNSYNAGIKKEFEQLQKRVREKASKGYNDMYITTLLAEERYSDARDETLRFIEDTLKKGVSIAPLQQVMISVLNTEKKHTPKAEFNKEMFETTMHDVCVELLGYHTDATTNLMYDILLYGFAEYKLAIDISMEHRLYAQAENLATYATAAKIIPAEQLEMIKNVRMNEGK